VEADKLQSTIRQSEKLVRALANRYGFKSRDFSLIWDDGEFEASRGVHELVIVAADGRRSTAQIDHGALLRQDAWKYFNQLDTALMHLARREEPRGV